MNLGRNWMMLGTEALFLDRRAALWRLALRVAFRSIILGCVFGLLLVPLLYHFQLVSGPLRETMTLIVILSWLFAGMMSGACVFSMGEVIRDLARSRAEFERLSRTDSLSGLSNRRAFNDALDQVSSDASLAILDIDHFKQINDRFGHQAGDKVIREVASVLRAVVGDRGFVARLGGEEFGLILSGSGIAQRLALVERARNRVACETMRVAGVSLSVTVSAGIAEITPDLRAEMVYARADRALYRAKATGRNCVVHAQNLVEDEAAILPA